jgi:nicotinate-nucleotide--dimethylbenzimidazole phosphoribosyltransferase
MSEIVAAVRAALLADSDPGALLDELERRIEAAAAVLDPASAAASAALPASVPQPAAEPAPAVAETSPAATPRDDEQALLEALGAEPVTGQAEADHVPTVSEVIFQLGRADPATEAAAPAGDGGTAVKALEAMVEELAASMPAQPPEPAVAEVSGGPAVAEPEPTADVTEEMQTARIEVETQAPESAAAAMDAAPPEPVAPETAAAPDDAIVPESEMAHVETAQAEPAPEMEAAQPVVAAEDAAPAEAEASGMDVVAVETDVVATETDVTAIESAPPAPEEVAPAPDAPASPPETQSQGTAAIGVAAVSSAVMPEVELLSNFARMETMPFLPPELGTAVIFEPKVPAPAAEAAPPQAAALGEAELIMPPPEPDAAGPEKAAVQPPAEVDLDALLFGPEPEPDPDPAASLLEPLPPENAPAKPMPAPEAAEPQATASDPLAPLKAMSEEEKIALFE